MKEYKYEIYPFFNKVKAEISFECKITGFNLHVLDKSFGSFLRKPIESDYLKAEKWVKNQLKYIENANK